MKNLDFGYLLFPHIWRNVLLPAIYNYLHLMSRGRKSFIVSFGSDHVTLKTSLNVPSGIWRKCSEGGTTFLLMTISNSSLLSSPCSYFLLCPTWKWKWSRSAEPTLRDPMDCSPPGSSIHGIFQARVLEWVVISFSRGSSPPSDRTWVSRIAGRYFIVWATREALNPTSMWPQTYIFSLTIHPMDAWVEFL